MPRVEGWTDERWIRRAWGLLITSSAVYFLADNEADNDLWVHVLIGRRILATGAPPRVDDLSYTAAGAPWIDHEWLAQSILAGVFDLAGTTGLWVFKLALGVLAVWLLWRAVAQRSTSVWVYGPVMVLVPAVLGRGFAVRPQIFTYMALAALLAWLDRDTPGVDVGAHRAWRPIAGMALAFAVWANTHGGFVVGLGVLGLFAVTAPGRDGGWRWGLFLAAVAAACVNPYGPRLFAYIANELHWPHPLTEWQPVALRDPAHLPFLLMLAAVILTLPFGHTLRRRPWRAVLIAIVAVMSLRHQRHTPLLAICAAAPLAEQLDGALVWLRHRVTFGLSPPAHAVVAAALGVLAISQVSLMTQRLWHDRFRIVYDATDYPVGAVRFLRQAGITGNLALPLDWGGYALWHAAPAVKVSIDGRFATVYSPQVVEDNFALFRGEAAPGAARLLARYPTQMVLAPRGADTPVQRHADWHVAYLDSVAVLFAGGAPRAPVTGDAPRGRVPFP